MEMGSSTLCVLIPSKQQQRAGSAGHGAQRSLASRRVKVSELHRDCWKHWDTISELRVPYKTQNIPASPHRITSVAQILLSFRNSGEGSKFTIEKIGHSKDWRLKVYYSLKGK